MSKKAKHNFFTRCSNNPILVGDDVPGEVSLAFNPGAVIFDDKVLLLVRVEGSSGYSSIHTATSQDGISGWDIRKKPLLSPESGRPYEEWGCEDARVISADGCYYITYTAYSHHGPATALAVTFDFKKIKRLGIILPPYNKDSVLFPKKIRNKWYILHRPYAGASQNIWISSSQNMSDWGDHRCLMEKGKGGAWDSLKIGAGPPPLLTKKGWLLFYHGVREICNTLVYKMGVVLLQRNNPNKVLYRPKSPVFEAKADYEMEGNVPNVVFPTGVILKQDDLYLYYGASDAYVCLATAKLSDILKLFD